MALRDDIFGAQQAALKSGDTARLATLRMLWSAIRTEEIDTHTTLDDAAVLSIIARQVKQLEDALSDFTRAGRTDLADKTEQERTLLRTYLPAQASDEMVRDAVDRAVAALGVSDPSAIGRVMGIAMKELAGRADGNRVRRAAEDRLRS